ncbi:MAG: deoxyribose-phosphate aldolase [Acidobacteria bacterium]|nr:deoxyribose-phosphate aldolase [Acidobacteriota bacterium]
MVETVDELAKAIDYTLLKPQAERKVVLDFLEKAKKYRFYSVCILPYLLPLAAKKLAKSEMRLSTVVAFPFGGTTKEAKIAEAVECAKIGATELDIVINLPAVKMGDYSYVKEELRLIMEKTPEVVHKMIIEISLLSPEELDKVIGIMNELSPAFVKTGTGFTARGVSVSDVLLLRKRLDPRIKIKAAGGIRDLEAALALIDAGAKRLGTSAGVEILKEFIEKKGGAN